MANEEQTSVQAMQRDARLFRFWIWAASRITGKCAKAIANAVSPADYRKALLELAESEGLDLSKFDDLQY